MTIFASSDEYTDGFVTVFSDAIVVRKGRVVYLLDYEGNVISSALYQPPEVVSVWTNILSITRGAIAWRGCVPVEVSYSSVSLRCDRVYISDLYGNTLATFRLSSIYGNVSIESMLLAGSRSGYTLVLLLRMLNTGQGAGSSSYAISIIRLRPAGEVTVPVVVVQEVVSVTSTVTRTITREFIFTRTTTLVKLLPTGTYTRVITVKAFPGTTVTKYIYVPTTISHTVTATLKITRYLRSTETMFRTIYKPRVMYATVTSTVFRKSVLTTTVTKLKALPGPGFLIGIALASTLIIAALLILQHRRAVPH